MAYLEYVARVVLALVFLASTVSKLRGRHGFAGFVQAVRDIRLVPGRLVPAVARAVVGLEGLTTILLTSPGFGAAGEALAALMLTAFTTVVVVLLRRGVRARCACFGGSGTTFGPRHVMRNGCLLVLAVGSLLSSSGWWPQTTPPSAPGIAVAVLLAGLIAVLVIKMDDLAAILTRTRPAP